MSSEEKCFCHLNGYKVKDADARAQIKTVDAKLDAFKSEVGDLKTNLKGQINTIDNAVGNYITANNNRVGLLENDVEELKTAGTGGGTKFYKHYIIGEGQKPAFSFLSKQETAFTLNDIVSFYDVNYDDTTSTGNVNGDNILEMSTLFYNDSIEYGGTWIKVSKIDETGVIYTVVSSVDNISIFGNVSVSVGEY